MTEARLRQISPEVFYSDGAFLAVDGQTIDRLKSSARTSPRRRCRLCFHGSSDASQQEMLIVMHRDSYVRPHRHFGKSETLTVIDGSADTLLFDNQGRVTQSIRMSPPAEGQSFFYRMPAGTFHTLIFRSEWFVFLETTIGPFDPAQSEGALWAPEESDPTAGHGFLQSLTMPSRTSC
ncbi:MAG: WbuC family cupin fold metalloprotein [Parvibaculaceae bacterium]